MSFFCAVMYNVNFFDSGSKKIQSKSQVLECKFLSKQLSQCPSNRHSYMAKFFCPPLRQVTQRSIFIFTRFWCGNLCFIQSRSSSWTHKRLLQLCQVVTNVFQSFISSFLNSCFSDNDRLTFYNRSKVSQVTGTKKITLCINSSVMKCRFFSLQLLLLDTISMDEIEKSLRTKFFFLIWLFFKP